MSSDAYLTIKSPTETLIKEKSSKFFAYAFPVQNTDEVELRIHELKKTHLKARHFCYAYFLNADRQLFRASDDGEPSGTAGRPILGQLEKRNLTNTLVVVVRYFGGTKLGTSGLIQAYKESSSQVLDGADIIEEIISASFKIVVDYGLVGELMSIFTSLELTIIGSSYGETASLTLETRKSEIDTAKKKIKALLLDRPLEDIAESTVVPGVEFILD